MSRVQADDDQGLNGWRLNANCRTAPPALFFPRGDAKTYSAPALAYCASCPVRTECLRVGLAQPDQYGVWGGYTARERRALKKNAAQQRRPKVDA